MNPEVNDLEEEWRAKEKFLNTLYEEVFRLDGTISCEYGNGRKRTEDDERIRLCLR